MSITNLLFYLTTLLTVYSRYTTTVVAKRLVEKSAFNWRILKILLITLLMLGMMSVRRTNLRSVLFATILQFVLLVTHFKTF